MLFILELFHLPLVGSSPHQWFDFARRHVVFHESDAGLKHWLQVSGMLDLVFREHPELVCVKEPVEFSMRNCVPSFQGKFFL